jgi:hypothetical protein
MPTIANTQTIMPTRQLFLKTKDQSCFADQVAPTCYMEEVEGKIYRFDESNMLLEDDTWTSRGGSPELDYDFSTTNYSINDYGDKVWIDYQQNRKADPVIRERARKTAITRIKANLLLKKEYRLAQILFNASNFSGQTSALAGNNRWDNPNSVPTANYITATNSLDLNSSQECNSLIIGFQAAQGLRNNPDILSIMRSNDLKVVTKEVIAEVFGLDPANIYIGKAKYRSTLSATPTYIWGKSALFCYIDPKANTVDDDTLIKQVRLKNGVGEYYQYFEDPDKSKKGEWADAHIDYGFALTNYKCGYLFTTVVS